MNDTHTKIIATLAQENRALKIKEIAALTQLDPHTAARNLDVLEVIGKVKKIVVGTSKKYHLIESIPIFSLIDISSDLIIILDTSYSIQYINRKAKEFLKIEGSHVIGEKIDILQLDLFSDPGILDGLTHFSSEKVFRREIPYEYQGKKIWYAISIVGLALSLDDLRIAIIAEDITDKKQYQQKLVVNEEKLRSITHNIPGIVFRYNIRNNTHEFFNDNLEKITGYRADEIVSHDNLPFYSITHPDDAQYVIPKLLESIKTGNEYTIQYKIIKKDVSIIHVYEQGRIIPGLDGKPEYIDGIIFEISDIIETAARHRSLFESAPIAIVEDDFSELYTFFSMLKEQGISDLHTFFDSQPDAVLTCKKLIKNVGYNPQFHRLLELEPNEGVSFFEKSSIFIEQSEKALKELFIALAEGKNEYQGDIPVRTAKGNILDLIFHVSVVPETTHPLSRVLISCIDNTHRKKTREELQKSKRNLQAIFDNTYSAFMLIDKDFKIRAYNAAAQQGSLAVFQRTMAEGESIWNYVREEDRESFLSHFNKALAGEKIQTELKYPLKNSSEQWYEFQYSPVYNEKGVVDSVFFTAQDITEKKQTHDALLKAEHERLLLAQEAGKQGMYEIQIKTGSVIFSPAFYSMHGYSPGVFQSTTDVWPRLIHPDDNQRLRREREESLKKSDTFSSEYRIKHHDGSWMWVEGRTQVIARDERGDPEVLIGIHTDITSRKLAEEALKESEMRLRQIADATDDALFMHIGGEIREVNASAVRIFGYSEQELKSMHVLSLVTPDYREFVRDRLSETDDETYESEGITKNGQIIKLLVKATTIRTGNQSVRFSAVRDITSIIEKETEIKASEERFRSLVQNSPNAITLIDEQGIIIEWNKSAETMFGISRKEALGAVYGDLLPSMIIPERRTSDTIGYITATIRDALQTGRSAYFNTPIEAEIVRPDGSRRYIRQTIFPIQTKKGYRIGSITQDITEQKENEIKLQTAHFDLQAAYEQISATEEELRLNYEELENKSNELKESREALKLKLDHILTPDYDITDEELSNIIDCEEIQQIMNDFHDLSGIGIAIVDLKGKILVATGWQDICTRFHRVHFETAKNCLESDLKLTTGIQPGEVRAYKCRNNLWDIATPIMIGSRQVGNLFLGQFFYSDEGVNREAFREQAEAYGFDTKAYLAALDRVPRWTRETVDTVMHFYTRFARLISRLSYTNISHAKTLVDYEQIMQQLAKSQEKYRRYSEFSPHGILVADASGRLVDVNPKGCSMLGYSRDELMDMGIGCLYPDEKRPHAEERFLTLIRTGYSSLETRMQRKDGSDIPILLNAVSLPDNSYMAFIIDLTEREEARKREASALERIEKNIHQLASLNDQIRNPLTVINGLCEMDEPAHYEQIQEHILKIDQIIREVDRGWLESVKIREYLKKHHGIIITEDD